MTIEETIKFLQNERACVVRQTDGGCDRNCAVCDLVLPDRMVLSAYGTAIGILLSQQREEKNEPLTPEELRNMDGEPVFVTTSRLYAGGITKYFRQWMLVDVREDEYVEEIFLVNRYRDRWKPDDPNVVEIRRRPAEEVEV